VRPISADPLSTALVPTKPPGSPLSRRTFYPLFKFLRFFPPNPPHAQDFLPNFPFLPRLVCPCLIPGFLIDGFSSPGPPRQPAKGVGEVPSSVFATCCFFFSFFGFSRFRRIVLVPAGTWPWLSCIRAFPGTAPDPPSKISSFRPNAQRPLSLLVVSCVPPTICPRCLSLRFAIAFPPSLTPSSHFRCG